MGPEKTAALFLLVGEVGDGGIGPFGTGCGVEAGACTSNLGADFGEPFTGSYLPSATNTVPEDDPSTNSTTGGRSLLKLSMSLAGLYCGTDSGD